MFIAEHAVVRVPDVRGVELDRAFTQLQRAGFKVSIPKRFLLPNLSTAVAGATAPVAGAAVVRGDTIKLVKIQSGGLGSPASDGKTRYVPNVTGMTVTAARRAIEDARLSFLGHLGPLKATSKPHLYDLYRVTKQAPAAGTKWKLGRTVKGGGFLPTPVTVTATAR